MVVLIFVLVFSTVLGCYSYAQVNPFGFIETPYRKVVDGKLTEQIDYLTADEEDRHVVAQANTPFDKDGNITELRCHHDPDTLGKNPEGYKANGVIHWVSAKHALDCEIRNYERLFSQPDPMAADNFLGSTYKPLLKNYEALLNLKVDYVDGDGQTESNITNRLGNPSQYDAFAINMVKTDNAASYTAILNQ